MQRIAKALAFALTLLLGQATEATLTIIKKDKFDVNWYFRNTSTKYTAGRLFQCYYRDYDNDGLPDCLIVLTDPKTKDWRLFTLNTAPTGGEKIYPTNRTAGRDITAQLRVFVPNRLLTPYAPSMDSPDLVLVGTNDISTDPLKSLFTKFIFWRLNKTNPAFPTETTWAIDVASTDTPEIYWPDVSVNGDDYPDFFIYNTYANVNRQFVISCHDGRNGAQIWSRTLGLDREDPGTGIASGGKGSPSKSVYRPLGFPHLGIEVLPHRPERGLVGDFDSNGKPEIFLHYAFGRGDVYTTYSMTSDINLLNSSGNFLSPYSGVWTRLRVVNSTIVRLETVKTTDYNKDGYVDLLLLSMGIGQPPAPLFEAYNLKGRQFLFGAVNSDLDGSTQSLQGFAVLDEYSYHGSRPADVNGDGWNDLLVYRSTASPPNMPLRVGMFNAYAGGGVQKGRKMWLTQFDMFNAAFPLTNDFNEDNLLDFVLVREPDQPDSPTLGRVTWHIANTAVSAKDIRLGKQFNYSPPHSFAWNPKLDSFSAFRPRISGFGDVDGDGERDTLACMACGFDTGHDGTWDLSYGYVFLYDNTSGLTTPPLTAELQFKVQGENWVPNPVFGQAYSLAGYAFVDNNRDGYANDVIVDLGKAIFAMSFQYRIIGGPPKLETATLLDLDGNGVDGGDQLVLTLDRGVVVTSAALRASHFFLPVQGDSLGGTGFGISASVLNSREIILTLGQGARLRYTGIFSMSNRAFGSPSGIDFATSLPVGTIRSFDGISAVNGGAPGANDSGVDIQINMIGRSALIPPDGGMLSVVNSPDAAYREHYVTVPGVGTTRTLGLSQPATNLIGPGAVQITSNRDSPGTINLEYRDGDIDWESGYIEGEMHVHQWVKDSWGRFSYILVPGSHRLQSALQRGRSGVRRLNGGTNQVSVDTSSILNPCGTLGTPGLFAGLPIETVDERTIHMKPGGAGMIRKGEAAVLAPGSLGAYTLHRLEFPSYVTTTETDPQRIVVKMRMATLAERYSQTGGQSFPAQSGAVFVVTATDAVGQPISFTSPVNMTIQFKERPDPTLSDVVCFDGQRALASNMRLVRDQSEGDAVDFEFAAAPVQSVNTSLGTLTVQNLVGLTGADGMGTFGAVATAGLAPSTSWRLYR